MKQVAKATNVSPTQMLPSKMEGRFGGREKGAKIVGNISIGVLGMPIIGIMEVRIEGKSTVVGASGEKDPQSVVHS